MSNHTRGPWMFRSQANGGLDFFGEDGNRVILQNARLINQDANARLIAASPDLLEALSLLVAGIEDSVSSTFIPLVKARTAIAKAKGEQS